MECLLHEELNNKNKNDVFLPKSLNVCGKSKNRILLRYYNVFFDEEKVLDIRIGEIWALLTKMTLLRTPQVLLYLRYVLDNMSEL